MRQQWALRVLQQSIIPAALFIMVKKDVGDVGINITNRRYEET